MPPEVATIVQALSVWRDKPVAVGLSGGVDSAVAAYLLQAAGAKVTAWFMKNWDDGDADAACHDKDDLLCAAAVAERLNVGFDVLDFTRKYRERVFAEFVRELEAGRTPNPDILCNSRIKFAVFHERALAAGAVAVATGHYAGREFIGGEWRLKKGEDSGKDQSYFLCQLTQAQLARAIFPLATMHKSAARALARRIGLPNWSRKDSTGLCFVGERDFPRFIAPYVRAQAGDMVDDIGGAVVGRHRGLPFYTIGQRRGLGLGGGDGPWFVTRKDPAHNRLYVAREADSRLLERDEVTVADPHWISRRPPKAGWVYSARLRHRQAPATCILTEVAPDRATIHFPLPQRAPTPGQFAAIYDGNTCLGGARITAA